MFWWWILEIWTSLVKLAQVGVCGDHDVRLTCILLFKFFGVTGNVFPEDNTKIRKLLLMCWRTLN